MQKIAAFLIISISIFLCLKGTAYSDKGICDQCKIFKDEYGNYIGDNCDKGWCAPFEDGRNRCVPNDVDPSDSYSCPANSGGNGGGGGGCFIDLLSAPYGFNVVTPMQGRKLEYISRPGQPLKNSFDHLKIVDRY